MNNKINLIRTKLIAPIPRKNCIKREKLISELSNIFDYKVTIVKGAAGSGKSTLLSCFIEDKKPKNIRWVNLDESNNNIYSFWYYFIEAIKDYIPEQGEKLIDFLNGMVNKDDVLNIAAYIVNKISTEEDIIVVFDDYQYIKEKALNATVEYLIKYSPINMHYVFLTREEFPIYLGELRIRDELLEIDESELRFSKEECLNFIKNTLKFDLSEEFVSKVFSISEGWIGGIQLTALAFKNKKDIEKIDVINKYVIEYLTEEILKGLNEEERNFIIKTSILNWFDVEFCNYILKIDNSRDIINCLVDKNLFIITLNERENVFRYHHLFKEFLNINFEKLEESEKKELHLRAYNYLKENDDLNEGIKHLLEIKAYDKAIQDIEENITNIKLLTYIKEIPLENLMNSSELMVQRIFYHLSNMDIDACKQVIEKIYNSDKTELKAIANVFKLYIYNYHVTITDEDLKLIEKVKLSEITRAIIYSNIWAFFYKYNEYDKAMYYVLETDRIAKKYNMVSLSIFAKFQMASKFEEMGEFSKVIEAYREVKNIVDKNSFLSYFKFVYDLGVAGIYMKRYELDKAEKSLSIVSGDLEMHAPIIKNTIIYHNMEFCFVKGEVKKGIEMADKLIMEYSASKTFIPCRFFSAKLKFTLPLKAYKEAELIEFKQLIEKYRDNKEMYITIEDEIVYCRVLYLLLEKEKALKNINEALEGCRKYSMGSFLIEGIIIKILILEKDFNTRKREIYNLLREAFHYSIQNRYLRVYIIEGKWLLQLIKKLKNDNEIELNNNEKEFIQRIIDIEEPNKAQQNDLLSEREKEVLKVLCEGHSNKEIAEILHISLATVKTHMINIYSKLEVSNRVQAVEKAKKVGLIT